MPEIKLLPQPGFNTQKTQTLNAGGWSSGNLVRWKNKLLEKIGGWFPLVEGPASDYVRRLHAYQDLSHDTNLLIGNDTGLQIYQNGVIYNASVIASVVNLSLPWLATTNLLTTVVVTDADHGLATGDTIYIPIPFAVGGLVVTPGDKTITVISSSTYSFENDTAATSTTTGGTPVLFTTTAASAAIVGTLTGHPYAIAGSYFSIPTAVSVGGLTLQGNYVAFRQTANTFVIFTSSFDPATSNDTAYQNEDSGGTPLGQVQYYYTPPLVFETIATSYPAAPWLSTVSGSATVTITDRAHGRSTGDLIQFPVAYTVGGITFYPNPEVTYEITVTGADTYTITAPTTATSTESAGKPCLYESLSFTVTTITCSFPNHGLAVGDVWTVNNTVRLVNPATTVLTLLGNYTVTAVLSSGSFRFDAGGAAITGTSTATPAQVYEVNDGTGLDDPGTYTGYVIYSQEVEQSPAWSLDNFGDVGVVGVSDGPICIWTPPISATRNIAQSITTAPQINTGCIVAMPQAQIVGFGSEAVIGGGEHDPLLLRWCDAGDYTVWTAAAENQAGSFRLSRGSKIMGAIQAPQTTLVWTDIDLWSMQYVGPPFVYQFSVVGSGCGLIAQNAVTILWSSCYWMGTRAFWSTVNGSVQQLECPVWDYVFEDLDTDAVDRCWAWSNSSFSEVWFFFPSLSGGTGEIDSYVKLNVQDNLWDYGSLVRTAGIDYSILGPPLAADGDRVIQKHETGYDDGEDAMDGVFAETGFFDLAEGQDILFLDQIIPDMKWFGETDGGYVKVTVTTRNYPGGPVQSFGPYTISNDTRFVALHGRARQIAIRIDWGAYAGYSARLGAWRLRVAQSGRRP